MIGCTTTVSVLTRQWDFHIWQAIVALVHVGSHFVFSLLLSPALSCSLLLSPAVFSGVHSFPPPSHPEVGLSHLAGDCCSMPLLGAPPPTGVPPSPQCITLPPPLLFPFPQLLQGLVGAGGGGGGEGSDRRKGGNDGGGSKRVDGEGAIGGEGEGGERGEKGGGRGGEGGKAAGVGGGEPTQASQGQGGVGERGVLNPAPADLRQIKGPGVVTTVNS
ncbi:unnamed protein product [Closterium sp. NIES-53]